MPRVPIVGVMGSGTEPHDALARPLGAWIASAGFHLLTGGGDGVMRAASEAFVAVEDRAGLCLGILPGPDARPGYPNDAVELAIRTHLPLSGELGTDPRSRNHVNVLTADVIVALPGGGGTRAEVALALRYGRPVLRYGPLEAFEGFARTDRVEDLAGVTAWIEARLARA